MNFEKVENQTEKKEDLYRYTYRRYDKDRTLVFECEARGILAADEAYEKATGSDPSKDSHIGCSIKKIEETEILLNLEKEKEDKEFEEAFQKLQKIILILSEMGLKVVEYCQNKKIIKGNFDKELPFPLVRDGVDGIRADYDSEDKEITVTFTNLFEKEDDPTRLKVTKKLRKAGVKVV